MTTELAFAIMIQEKGVHHKLGVARGTVYKWRHDAKTGNNKISLDLKVQLLQRAGFFVITEMHWCIGQPDAKRGIDYLNDFPGLTMIGRQAGFRDETIRQLNETIVKDPGRFRKIYRNVG